MSNMLRPTFVLFFLIFFCNDISANQKVLDVNSDLFRQAFDEYLQNMGGKFDSSQLVQLRQTFIDLLKNNGFTVNNAPGTQLPPVLQPGLPAQPTSQPAQPYYPNPQQSPPSIGSVQPYPGSKTPNFPSLQQTPPSKFSQGLSGVRETFYDAAGNQINNIFEGTKEVIKGTDEVLNEGDYQILRLNNANKELLKQKARTTGNVITKVPETGTSWLQGIDSFFENPTKYISPFYYFQKWNPFNWNQPSVSATNIAIDNLMNRLRERNKTLHIKLTELKNRETYSWLKDHSDVFKFLLLEENWQALKDVLDNPVKLAEYGKK